MAQQSYKLDLELIRIISIYWVIYNHTDAYYIYNKFTPDSVLFYIATILAQFCKFSVPVFLMISGALLLGKEESLKKIYTHRIFRMTVILVLFSAFYCFIDSVHQNYYVSINDFFVRLYHDNWNTSFWYLWTYIAYLMLLPFLRSVAKKMTTNLFYYLIILVIIFSGLLPIVSFLMYGEIINITPSFTLMGTLAWSVTYPLLGYVIERDKISLGLKGVIGLLVIDIICLWFSSYLTMRNIELHGRDGQVFFNCFTIINSLTMYLFIKEIYKKYRIKLDDYKKVIIYCGRSVFGAYLVHISVMIALGKINWYGFLKAFINQNDIAIYLMYAFMVFVISMTVGGVMKKIF